MTGWLEVASDDASPRPKSPTRERVRRSREQLKASCAARPSERCDPDRHKRAGRAIVSPLSGAGGLDDNRTTPAIWSEGTLAGRTRFRRSHSMIEAEAVASSVPMRSSGRRTTPIFMERTMYERELEPVEPGWGVPTPQPRERTPKTEERRQAGTPATLEGNIDKGIDKYQHTVNQRPEQGRAVRWLVSHYAVSSALAAIIASELGMGGRK